MQELTRPTPTVPASGTLVQIPIAHPFLHDAEQVTSLGSLSSSFLI